MANNKITTKSYFMKRLRDGGYAVDRLAVEFSEDDSRRWAVVIDNGCSSVIAFCHKDSTFSFYDGQRYLPCNLKLSTDSIEVVVEHLHNRGIIHKHSNYGKLVDK